MKARYPFAAIAFSLLLASSANAQITNGVMTVTGAEMHWWAGVACDATARLYDVDEHSVVFYKLQKTKKYDQGTITFRARKGKLISLKKLHESVWATRLSNRTRSGLVSLQVTVVGKVVTAGGKTVLQVSGSKAEFVLGRHSAAQFAPLFGKLQAMSGERVVQITGVIDDYQGRWPAVLAKKPPKTRRILVTGLKPLGNK